jgi:hypothetical protein
VNHYHADDGGENDKIPVAMEANIDAAMINRVKIARVGDVKIRVDDSHFRVSAYDEMEGLARFIEFLGPHERPDEELVKRSVHLAPRVLLHSTTDMCFIRSVPDLKLIPDHEDDWRKIYLSCFLTLEDGN